MAYILYIYDIYVQYLLCDDLGRLNTKRVVIALLFHLNKRLLIVHLSTLTVACNIVSYCFKQDSNHVLTSG